MYGNQARRATVVATLSSNFRRSCHARRKAESEGNMTEWRMSAWQKRDGNPKLLAEELVTELENSYPTERLRILVWLGGFEERPQRQE